VSFKIPVLSSPISSGRSDAPTRFELLTFLPLVRSAGRLAVFGMTGVVGVDELSTDGVVGLLQAAWEYKSTNRDEFRARSNRAIRGAVSNALKELEAVSEETRRTAWQVSSVMEELAQALHRSPTDLEIAARLGMGETDYFRLAGEIERVLPVPMDALLSEDAQSLVVSIADTKERGDTRAQRKEARSLLFDAIGKLPERRNSTIHLTFCWGLNVSCFGGLLAPSACVPEALHDQVAGVGIARSTGM